MPTFIPPRFQPWFDDLCLALGMAGTDLSRSGEAGGFLVAGIPVSVSSPVVGADEHVLLQALVGELPANPHRAVLMERLLQWQMLLCGPDASAFGFEPSQQSLLLMRSVQPDALSAQDAAAVVRSLASIASQWVPVLRDPTLLARPISSTTTVTRHHHLLRPRRTAGAPSR